MMARLRERSRHDKHHTMGGSIHAMCCKMLEQQRWCLSRRHDGSSAISCRSRECCMFLRTSLPLTVCRLPAPRRLMNRILYSSAVLSGEPTFCPSKTLAPKDDRCYIIWSKAASVPRCKLLSPLFLRGQLSQEVRGQSSVISNALSRQSHFYFSFFPPEYNGFRRDEVPHQKLPRHADGRSGKCNNGRLYHLFSRTCGIRASGKITQRSQGSGICIPVVAGFHIAAYTKGTGHSHINVH